MLASRLIMEDSRHSMRSAFARSSGEKKPRRELCRFVAVPDVVGSARRTSEVFDFWIHEPILSGWPLAYVAQDGVEHLTIPWGRIDAIFIGGTTDWKLSRFAKECIAAAKLMRKWVHVGRVNTPGRFELFEKLGADSIDGTGLARYSHMREKIARAAREPSLFTESAAVP